MCNDISKSKYFSVVKMYCKYKIYQMTQIHPVHSLLCKIVVNFISIYNLKYCTVLLINMKKKTARCNHVTNVRVIVLGLLKGLI